MHSILLVNIINSNIFVVLSVFFMSVEACHKEKSGSWKEFYNQYLHGNWHICILIKCLHKLALNCKTVLCTWIWFEYITQSCKETKTNFYIQKSLPLWFLCVTCSTLCEYIYLWYNFNHIWNCFLSYVKFAFCKSMVPCSEYLVNIWFLSSKCVIT